MPFFQSAFYNPVAADPLANIFQLVGDIDSYQQEAAAAAKSQKLARQQQREARQQAARAQARTHAGLSQGLDSLNSFFGVSRTFNPRFDVRETEAAYELHGELAGVDRNNVSLEFTEPQTLVISGRVERNYTSGSNANNNNNNAPAAPAPVEAAPEATPEAVADTHSEPEDEPMARNGARTPTDEDEPFTEIVSPRTPSPARSHRATVTDEATEAALERGKDVTTEETAAAAPAAEQKQQQQQQVAAPKAPAAPTEHYWVQERTVGQFKRVFNFPVPVDEASVRASLDNGILSVSVPKAKREARRIVVF